MFTTYVLRSETSGALYTGSTSALNRRFAEHNSDLSISTKGRGPLKLVHREDFATLAEAVRRERYFKTGKGREELQRLLARPRSSAG
jgi:putative endonuclease